MVYVVDSTEDVAARRKENAAFFLRMCAGVVIGGSCGQGSTHIELALPKTVPGDLGKTYGHYAAAAA